MIDWLRLIPRSSPIFFSGSTSFQRTALSPIGFMSVVASFLLTMTLLISSRSGGDYGTDGLTEMREAPEVRPGLHALDVWAEHPKDGINPLTYALVDADESVRTRAQELYSQYLLGEEATAQSIQEDPVASDAQEPYTQPMLGEEAAAQFIQEDSMVSEAEVEGMRDTSTTGSREFNDDSRM